MVNTLLQVPQAVLTLPTLVQWEHGQCNLLLVSGASQASTMPETIRVVLTVVQENTTVNQGKQSAVCVSRASSTIKLGAQVNWPVLVVVLGNIARKWGKQAAQAVQRVGTTSMRGELMSAQNVIREGTTTERGV